MKNVEKILDKLVGIDSIFPNEGRVGEFIEDYLQKRGFKTFREYLSEGRFNLFGERGEGSKAILFYGHIDTVPAYGNWSADPMKLTDRGERLCGLGSSDMKGGIAAILDAVSRSERGRVKVLFCVDEENISAGAWKAVKEEKAWFDDVNIIISAESGDSERSEGGANVITLGRRGRCVISIEVHGMSAHGAKPAMGLSAIEEAAKIVLNVHRINLRRHAELGSESAFIREISGASTSLSIPDKAYVELDMHLVPPGTVEEAERRVMEFIEILKRENILNKETVVGVRAKARENPYLEPYSTDASDDAVKGIIQLIEEFGGKPEFNYGSSVADENVFANELGMPVITIGPSGGNNHSGDEWISRKSLEEIATLYLRIIENSKAILGS